MKLEYGSTTLGDDAAGDFIQDNGGGHSRLIQSEPLAGGTDPFQTARGNQSNVRSFTVSKEHATLAAAVEWFNTHPDGLAGADTLTISQEGSPAYSCTAAAVLQGVERVQLLGKSTLLTYTFLTKQITTAA